MNSLVILVLYFYRENSSISYNKVLEIHTWIVASLLSNEPRLLHTNVHSNVKFLLLKNSFDETGP